MTALLSSTQVCYHMTYFWLVVKVFFHNLDVPFCYTVRYVVFYGAVDDLVSCS